MKRLIVFLGILLISVTVFAQSYKMYIQVSYQPLVRTVTIMVGDEVVYPKDSQGQPRQFKTVVSVLNWLSKMGWHLEPIEVDGNSQQCHIFIMSRENTTDKEAVKMLK